MIKRVIVDVFPILYPRLASMQLDGRQRDALNQFARMAAGFGSVEAHLALAELSEDHADRLFHVLAARRLAVGKPIDDALRVRFEEAETEFEQLGNSLLQRLIEGRLESLKESSKEYELPDDIVKRIIEGREAVHPGGHP
jgi:hypothetical protein